MTAKVGRNEPCPCGSGRKYKKCCLGTSEATDAVAPSNELSSNELSFDEKALVAELICTTIPAAALAFAKAWPQGAAVKSFSTAGWNRQRMGMIKREGRAAVGKIVDASDEKAEAAEVFDRMEYWDLKFEQADTNDPNEVLETADDWGDLSGATALCEALTALEIVADNGSLEEAVRAADEAVRRALDACFVGYFDLDEEQWHKFYLSRELHGAVDGHLSWQAQSLFTEDEYWQWFEDQRYPDWLNQRETRIKEHDRRVESRPASDSSGQGT